METLVINVNPQIGGYNFGLSPKVRKQLQALFPEAIQVRHIYVSYDTAWDFEQMHDKVTNQILPFLTGVALEHLAEHFQKIEFINPSSDTLEYEISLNAYVQEKQLVSR